MTSAKMATPDLLKIKVFWSKVYYVIYSVYDVTNKILSNYLNHIEYVVIWSKFGNCSISMGEVIITSTLLAFDQKTRFFNNLELALGTNSKFYTSVSKGLALKVRKFCGLIFTFREVTGEKLVRGPFYTSTPILNRVKDL